MRTHQVRSPGKTTFLNFMLAQLISPRQVVVLCDNFKAYLFYSGQVYSRSMALDLEALPNHPQIDYFPIWALIDADLRSHELPFTYELNIWPIQASSPNTTRWKAWSKQFGAAVLGLPLWNMGELMKGCVFGVFSLSSIDPGHVV